MPSTTKATSQGGVDNDGAGTTCGSSLVYSGTTSTRYSDSTYCSQTVRDGLTATESMTPFFFAMATHEEDSELDGYLGDSPKYDEEEFEDEGFVTAAGGETDRASQASGHGGGTFL